MRLQLRQRSGSRVDPEVHIFEKTRMELRLGTDESGSNLIEIALVLPVYFLLCFTLMSFSIVLFAYGNATYASKAAVRYAIVHGAASANPCVAADLQAIVTPFLWGAPTNTVVTPSWVQGNNAVGNWVAVTVVMNYSTGMPYGYLSNLQVSTTAQGVILH